MKETFMTVLKCFATATLLLSVSACGPGYQAYRSDSPYSLSAYVYTTGQPTYYNSSLSEQGVAPGYNEARVVADDPDLHPRNRVGDTIRSWPQL
jgi:hypothetical protein